MFHVKHFTLTKIGIYMDINPTIEQRKLLDKHLELVIQENTITNLTRIIDWE